MPIKDVTVIDGSHWRWPTPLQKVIDDGNQAFITKATEATGWTDDFYDDWDIEAEALGLDFGSFHYWRAAFDAQVQAKHYFDVATARRRPLFPPIIDVEKTNNIGVLNISARAAHLHLTVLETEKLWGEKPWIYTGYYVVKDLLGNPEWLGDYKLFVASYRNDRPSIPVPWSSKPAPQYELWQYTKSHPIPGTAFKGYDQSYYKGTKAEYDAWKATRTQVPGPPPPEFPFAGEIMAPDNINVFDVPKGKKVGLITHGMGVYVEAELQDAEGVRWNRLGTGSYIKAKYVKPVE